MMKATIMTLAKKIYGYHNKGLLVDLAESSCRSPFSATVAAKFLTIKDGKPGVGVVCRDGGGYDGGGGGGGGGGALLKFPGYARGFMWTCSLSLWRDGGGGGGGGGGTAEYEFEGEAIPMLSCFI